MLAVLVFTFTAVIFLLSMLPCTYRTCLTFLVASIALADLPGCTYHAATIYAHHFHPH
jgi:hypothetical protein